MQAMFLEVVKIVAISTANICFTEFKRFFDRGFSNKKYFTRKNSISEYVDLYNGPSYMV